MCDVKKSNNTTIVTNSDFDGWKRRKARKQFERKEIDVFIINVYVEFLLFKIMHKVHSAFNKCVIEIIGMKK